MQTKRIFQLLVIVTILFPSIHARADGLFGQAHTVQGHKANTHLEQAQVHKKHESDCNSVESIGWSIDLIDYQDGDTPYPDYYADYLSDLGWYVNEFNSCPITPESDPGQ